MDTFIQDRMSAKRIAISFVQNSILWHLGLLDDDQYDARVSPLEDTVFDPEAGMEVMHHLAGLAGMFVRALAEGAHADSVKIIDDLALDAAMEVDQ